ncbi:hypothetical protein K438DRAFT_1752631 [Mycena galopus ATCC 62051]|nr:hypothetical protein K438DRAFT_1752631 [Mycena galopus ATCC 62051]
MSELIGRMILCAHESSTLFNPHPSPNLLPLLSPRLALQPLPPFRKRTGLQQRFKKAKTAVKAVATNITNKIMKPRAPRSSKAAGPSSKKSKRSTSVVSKSSAGSIVKNSFIDLVPPTGAYRKIRDKMGKTYVNHAALRANTAKFDVLHFRPLALSTQSKQDYTKRLWLDYFTIFYGSRKRPKPPSSQTCHFHPSQMPNLIYGTPDAYPGLGFLTTWQLQHAATQGPTKVEPTQISNRFQAFVHWGLKEKVLATVKREKRNFGEAEQTEMLAAMLHSSVHIKSNFSACCTPTGGIQDQFYLPSQVMQQ